MSHSALPLEAVATNGIPPTQVSEEPEITRFLRLLLQHQGFDLHLKVGQPPLLRREAGLQPLDFPPLSQEDMDRLVAQLTPLARQLLDQEGSVAVGQVLGKCQFRLNFFRQRGTHSLVVRRITDAIPTFEDLGLPESIERLCQLSEGLIVVAGRAGSGRSTTVAAMLDSINAHRPLHILTLEDPIAFNFTDRKGFVNQREIGIDTRDWRRGLAEASHQDPDVILVGELRDSQTAEAAIQSAEAGHLVFATLHAENAPKAYRCLLDLFPPEKHIAIRKALGRSLRAIVAQMLVKGLKKPRVLASEILIVNPTVRKLIEEGEDRKLPDAIRLFNQEGMVDFTENFRSLVDAGAISKVEALEWAPDPEKLKMALKGIKVSAPGMLPEDLLLLEARAPVTTPAPPPASPTSAPQETLVAPKKSPTRAVAATPATVRRQATVRYFSRMYPDRLYRLLVVLSAEEVRKLVQHEVAQAASEGFEVRQEEPIEVEPILPGCTVYPPRREVTVSGAAPTEVRFQVAAQIQGGPVEDACVVIRQAGRELARVALGVRVGKPTLAYLLGAASVGVPVLLKFLKLDLDSQSGDDFSGYWMLVGVLLSLPWYLWTLGLLLAAGVAAWWTWPREDVFWDVKLEPTDRGN